MKIDFTNIGAADHHTVRAAIQSRFRCTPTFENGIAREPVVRVKICDGPVDADGRQGILSEIEAILARCEYRSSSFGFNSDQEPEPRGAATGWNNDAMIW